jgi:hypothetical protein
LRRPGADGLHGSEASFHQQRQLVVLGESGNPQRRRAGIRTEARLHAGVWCDFIAAMKSRATGTSRTPCAVDIAIQGE